MFEFCMTSNREGWSEMNYEHSQCAFFQKLRYSVFILSASHYKTMLTWPMCTLYPFIHKRKIKGRCPHSKMMLLPLHTLGIQE